MKSVHPPERTLTNDEIRLLAAYATMDNEAKQLVLDIAETWLGTSRPESRGRDCG